jgi:peroxiredoxin
MAFGCTRSTPEKNPGAAGKVPIPAGGGAIGSQAADFALADLSGKTVHLSDFKGKVVIVDFWATWCGPCRVEIPDFVRLQSKYRDKGLAIVGLSLDADGEKAVKPFVEEHDINYTMLIANDETAKSFGGILGIPTTFVIDRQGRIVQKFVGVMPAKTFEDTIQPLLES